MPNRATTTATTGTPLLGILEQTSTLPVAGISGNHRIGWLFKTRRLRPLMVTELRISDFWLRRPRAHPVRELFFIPFICFQLPEYYSPFTVFPRFRRHPGASFLLFILTLCLFSTHSSDDPTYAQSAQSPAFTPPMLSMAKMIMHRHVRSLFFLFSPQFCLTIFGGGNRINPLSVVAPPRQHRYRHRHHPPARPLPLVQCSTHSSLLPLGTRNSP